MLNLVSSNWSAMVAEVIPRPDGIERLSSSIRDRLAHVQRGLGFIGESTTALVRFGMDPARLRWRTCLNCLRVDGVNALPITGLLTFLIGVVIAYQAPSNCGSSAPIFLSWTSSAFRCSGRSLR